MHVGERSDDADAGVVADHVHGTVVIQRTLGEPLDGLEARHVGVHAERVTALRGDLAGDTLHAVAIEISEDDLRPFASERARHRGADAAAATGHDRDASSEIVHERTSDARHLQSMRT